MSETYTWSGRENQTEEFPRARTHLTSLGLAPGTPETLADLKNESKRPPRCPEPIPTDILSFSSGIEVIQEPSLLDNVHDDRNNNIE